MLSDQEATTPEGGYTLAVNTGSSSIKTVLYAMGDTLGPLATCDVEGIGQPSGQVRTSITPANGYTLQQFAIPDHASAIRQTLTQFAPLLAGGQLLAIGHRIVHGGPKHTQTTLLTDEVLTDLAAFSEVDPEHLPPVLATIAILRQRFADVPHIACFDTNFFETLPTVARHLALPRRFTNMGLRRYGFHGLSYEYLLSDFREHEGETAANGRVIFAHLGSGVSLAATKQGQPIDMTMSFSPASGVMMSTRSGDIDPGIVRFLQQQAGQTTDEFNTMIHKESGLLGVSGLSADMYTLLQQESHNEHAAEAVNLFCYQVKKAIGSLAAALGGVDSLVFAGGMGERAPGLRARICDGLEFLGIQLEPDQNQAQARCISPPGGRVGVHVIHTDETLMIARQTANLLSKTNERNP